MKQAYIYVKVCACILVSMHDYACVSMPMYFVDGHPSVRLVETCGRLKRKLQTCRSVIRKAMKGKADLRMSSHPVLYPIYVLGHLLNSGLQDEHADDVDVKAIKESFTR